MTLRRLADATGVSESRISDYEHGRHEPSVAMLQRLLEATGYELCAVPVSAGAAIDGNGVIFADALTVVDAIASDRAGRAVALRHDAPPTWKELIERSRVTR